MAKSKSPPFKSKGKSAGKMPMKGKSKMMDSDEMPMHKGAKSKGC